MPRRCMHRLTASLHRYSLPGGFVVSCLTRSETIDTISSRSICFKYFDSISPPHRLNDNTGGSGSGSGSERLAVLLTGSPSPSYISILYELARISPQRIVLANQCLHGSPRGGFGPQGSRARRGKLQHLASFVAVLHANPVGHSAPRVHTHSLRAQEPIS